MQCAGLKAVVWGARMQCAELRAAVWGACMQRVVWPLRWRVQCAGLSSWVGGWVPCVRAGGHVSYRGLQVVESPASHCARHPPPPHAPPPPPRHHPSRRPPPHPPQTRPAQTAHVPEPHRGSPGGEGGGGGDAVGVIVRMCQACVNERLCQNMSGAGGGSAHVATPSA